VAVERIAVDLPTALVANMLFQALLSRAQPLPGMRCTFPEAEIAQPKKEVLLKACGIDFIAMVFQETYE